MRYFFLLGALFCGLAVGLGAFGAHALKAYVGEYGLMLWERATYYQMIHGIAIIITTLAAYFFRTSRFFLIANSLFAIGIFCFSGSLYTIALTQIKAFGMIAPIGGVAFMTAWLLVLMGCFTFSSNITIPKGDSIC